jgi:hypothetical protein
MTSPHSGHGTVAGAVSASWARRLLRFDEEVLRLGTGMV